MNRMGRIYDAVRPNLRVQGILGRFLATGSTEPKAEVIDITTADEKPVYSSTDDPQFQERLARKRDKSRLNPQHRNILMGLRPFDTPMSWHHHKVKYKRRILGRYGLKASDEPAGFAWPTQDEIDDAKEYERVTFPLSLQERWKQLEEKKQERAEMIKARDDEIHAKMMKMEEWTKQLKAKIAKKEEELQAARKHKQRLVEELRRHFGFKISPHDERFKEMLQKKEKEEKKKKKEAKKQTRMEKLGMIPKEAESEGQEEVTDSRKSAE
ncbi:hypothetical protein EAG_01928 [Camponotus floridanus]|uniref:Large ribosomal subunit protein mL64 n=1 Tax=Camponotus floridanus TaxID=104421 RepID=E2B1J8_CAMFO|nr:hypothetical protein EAG_01928 [Camponotus floridanus]